MKTKEEIIREAWGFDFDEFVDNYGWKPVGFYKGEVLTTDEEIELKETYSFNGGCVGWSHFRPKILQGIEDNNSWVKIESEDDLPKEGMTNYFICVDGKPSIHVHNLRQVLSLFKDGMVSHYQPIVKPKSPVY